MYLYNKRREPIEITLQNQVIPYKESKVGFAVVLIDYRKW